MSKQFPLAIILETVDKSTATIRKINERFSGITKTLDQLRTKFKLLDKESGLSKSLESVKKITKELSVLAAVGGAVAYKLISGFADTGDALFATSRQLQVGVEWLQKMHWAGERNQMTAEQTTAALEDFSKKIGETAAGTGKAKAIFDAWGISVFDAHGKVKNMQELLPEVADHLSMIESAEVRNAVAARLFGDSGKNLAMVLKDGRSGLQAYFEEAEKFGLITQEQAEAGNEFNDRMTELKKSFEGIRNVLVGPMLPALTGFLKALTSFLQEHQQGIAFFVKFVATLYALWTALKVVRLLWALAQVMIALTSIAAAFGVALGWPVIAIFALIAAGYELVKHWSKIKEWWSNLWKGMNDDATIKLDKEGNPVPRHRGGYQHTAQDSGTDPASAATAGNGSQTNTNNASVTVDINGLKSSDTVSAKADRGMPFTLNQGFVMSPM